MRPYRVWANGGPFDEICEGEFDTLGDALDEMRKEWGGWPRRLEMPDGSNYKFPKDGEWRLPVYYKYFALRIDDYNFTANQNYLLKQIQEDRDLWMIIKLWRRKPVSWNSVIDWEKDCNGVMEAFVKLLGYGLLEEALFQDGFGFVDKKWRK